VQDDPAQFLVAEGQPFDAVVSTEVIEQFIFASLAAIFARKILSPGGYLVISTPYHGY